MFTSPPETAPQQPHVDARAGSSSAAEEAGAKTRTPRRITATQWAEIEPRVIRIATQWLNADQPFRARDLADAVMAAIPGLRHFPSSAVLRRLSLVLRSLHAHYDYGTQRYQRIEQSILSAHLLFALARYSKGRPLSEAAQRQAKTYADIGYLQQDPDIGRFSLNPNHADIQMLTRAACFRFSQDHPTLPPPLLALEASCQNQCLYFLLTRAGRVRFSEIARFVRGAVGSVINTALKALIANGAIVRPQKGVYQLARPLRQLLRTLASEARTAAAPAANGQVDTQQAAGSDVRVNPRSQVAPGHPPADS